MSDDLDRLNEIFGAESRSDGRGGKGGKTGNAKEDGSLLKKLDNRLGETKRHERVIETEVNDEPEERDYRPIRRSREGRTGCLGGIMYFVFVVSLSIILACVGWMAASDVLALNKDPVVAEIVLPEDIFTERLEDIKDDDGKVVGEKTVKVADIDYVTRVLKNAGIIEYKVLFKLFCAISNAEVKLDPGAYELSTDFDYRALVKKMQRGSGAAVTVELTFPEGFTVEQMFERLEDEGVSTKYDLYEAAANYTYNYSFLNSEDMGDSGRLEGYLFPDTYEFYIGEQASSVINKFLQNFHTKITADMYNQADNRGFSINQIIIIASMIEGEAANDDERAAIASVIYNRLAAGMHLQIDATVQYALEERKERLSYEDLEVDSPYNTYLHTGLPPGAVSNPGLASIQAALQPETTTYYYYALDVEAEEHRFFETHEQHQAFVATQDYSQP